VPDNVLAVKVIRSGHLLVIRQSNIQLLPVPRFDEQGRQIKRTTNAVGAYLHLHESAKEAVIITHELADSERSLWQCDPVTIIMRLSDAGFDTIRKYDIFPRSTVSPLPGETQTNGSPQIPSDMPCIFPHYPSTTIPVLPSCGSLAVGPNGKGFWIETRNITTAHSTYPARCFVGFDVTTHFVPPAAKSTKGERAVGHWASDLVVRERELYASRVGMGEVAQRKYRILASSLEDTVGRVAIGGRDGRVQILDFV